LNSKQLYVLPYVPFSPRRCSFTPQHNPYFDSAFSICCLSPLVSPTFQSPWFLRPWYYLFYHLYRWLVRT